MVAASAEPINSHEAGKPNYGQIYVYLSSLLKGETPASLPPLESSVVLTLIQDMVDKIRTSDVSGQMHYLSNWCKQFQGIDDTANKGDGKEKTSTSKSDASPAPVVAVKRTSSGRVIKQRSDLVHESNHEDNKEKEDEKVEAKQKGNSETNTGATATPRPTSLNPFHIPVSLLNFKGTKSTLVVRHVK